MLQPLILLFGHENSPDGKLSSVAVSRCNEAVCLSQKYPDAVILTTGAYGAHFNTTDHTHASYLTAYLHAEGVDPSRILDGTNSSNTLEDSLCARKVIIDGEYSPIHVVTSEYHAPRVLYILRRVFRSISFTIVEAKTPRMLIEREFRKESRAFARLKRNWVDPPIYEVNAEFPDAVYEASSLDQKHYDTVSLAAVTGAVFGSGILFQFGVDMVDSFAKVAMHAFGVLVILVLAVIYERCAGSARTARRSMRLTEVAFDNRGFSSGYDPDRIFRLVPSIQTAVRDLFVVLVFIQIALVVLFSIESGA